MSLSFPDGPMVAPPRPLLYLVAALRDLPAVETRVLDALAHPDPEVLASETRPVLFGLPADEVARRAAEWRADVVGVSTMANYYRAETLEIAHAVRSALPLCTIVLGGPDPTVDADRYLEEPAVDAVCVGEGEATLAELATRLAEGRPWRDTPGLAVRGDGGVHRTATRPLLDDLDRYVPDYAQVDLGHYFALAARGWRSRPTFLRPGVERSVDLVTSRGCPYPCTFCVIREGMGTRFRTRSVASVIRQLRALVTEHGVQHVHLEDDVLNLDRRRFVQLLHALIEARLPLTWDTPNGLRADLFDAETARLCVEAGCIYVIFGVESGNQRVLDEVVDKQLRLEEVEAAAAACDAAGLDALAFYIVGMPGETASEAEDTLAFAFRLFDDHGTTPLLQVWRPYVATPLHDRARDAGLLHDADPAVLHAALGIPYTQFRDRAAESPDLPLDVLADLFRRYSARLAQGQLARWRRAGLRLDPEHGTNRAQVEGFLLHEAPFLHARRRFGGQPAR